MQTQSDERTAHGYRVAVPALVIGVACVAASLVLGFWILASGNGPFAIDSWWNALVANAPSWLTGFAVAMGFVGGGWFAVFVIPLGGAALLLLARRRWSAVFFVAAQALSALLVQVLKHAFGRDRPDDIMVVSDFGSYPSGHVAGAATLAVTVLVLFPRIGVLIAGVAWVLLMALSRTVVHAHWLTDTVGGAFVGVGAALVAAALMVWLVAPESGAKRRAVER